MRETAEIIGKSRAFPILADQFRMKTNALVFILPSKWGISAGSEGFNPLFWPDYENV